jgi:hypothetical protein
MGEDVIGLGRILALGVACHPNLPLPSHGHGKSTVASSVGKLAHPNLVATGIVLADKATGSCAVVDESGYPEVSCPIGGQGSDLLVGSQLADPKRLAVGVVLAHKALACPCSCNPDVALAIHSDGNDLVRPSATQLLRPELSALGIVLAQEDVFFAGIAVAREGTVGHPCHPGIPPPVHCQGNNLVRSRGTKLPRPELSALGVVLAQENVTAPRRTLARKASFGDPCHPDIPLPVLSKGARLVGGRGAKLARPRTRISATGS